MTEFNYATNTGTEKYRQRVDKASGTGGAVDYRQLPRFKADWARNFEVDACRLEDAVADGDVTSQKKILAELTPARRKSKAGRMRLK